MLDLLSNRHPEPSLQIPADPARIYNTSVLLDRHGITTGVYRKIHLFDLNLPTVQLMESKTAAAGNELIVVDHEVGKLGMSICYDIRFPAMYQKYVSTFPCSADSLAYICLCISVAGS